jgi:hypothetical protein
MHPSNKITHENLKKAVYWQAPTAEKSTKYQAIAQASEVLMSTILDLAPDCADRTTALRAVREARMWANASIALEE